MTKRKEYSTMDMIKKEYITPTIEVVEMEVLTPLLGGSIIDGGTIGGNPNEEGEELVNRRRDYWNSNEWGW